MKFNGGSSGNSSGIFQDGAGDIGIGTTTPSAYLQIKGSSTSAVPQIRLSEEGDDYARIYFQNDHVGAWGLVGYKATANDATSLFNVYYSENSNGAGPGMDILNISGQGKVGINEPGYVTYTDADRGTLQINPIGTEHQLTLYSEDHGTRWGFYASNGHNLYLYWNGGLKGYFGAVDGTYYTFSDRRLKENIAPSGEVLGKLLDVDVMRYTFKSDERHQPQLGYIAQELEKQFPEFVNPPENIPGRETFYSVNYAGMSAVAIKAIQEQQAQIGEQQAQIETLKAQIGTLQTTVTQLQERLGRMGR